MSRQIWAGFARNKSIYFVSISVIARPSRSVSGSSRSLVASWPIISTNLPFLPHFAKIRGITNPANSTLHPPPFFFFFFQPDAIHRLPVETGAGRKIPLCSVHENRRCGREMHTWNTCTSYGRTERVATALRKSTATRTTLGGRGMMGQVRLVTSWIISAGPDARPALTLTLTLAVAPLGSTP